jgi:hypothetical protein
MRNVKQQNKAPFSSQRLAKRIVSTRPDGSRSVKINFSSCSSRCKPEFQRECDINNIVRMPLPPPSPLCFMDISNPPDLSSYFSCVQNVTDMFETIPSDIRRLMNNDPSQLQSFILDPSNTDLLVSRGVLRRPNVDRTTVSSETSPEPPAGNSSSTSGEAE